MDFERFCTKQFTFKHYQSIEKEKCILFNLFIISLELMAR